MMEANAQRRGSDPPQREKHLCVLVHGLWGNSQHLEYISQSLRDKYDDDQVIVHPCTKNASFFTYDGIEVGGERVAREIEEKTESLANDGCLITRFSIVGYSLGGLFARYAIGLLDNKGYFDHIKPVNFTTFASPHLGVRKPFLGVTSHIWNFLGARTLSASGQQLFMVDNFRNTGRPLLSILADLDSIFIHALSKFERRTLYANIVNDRTTAYYTAGVSSVDPFTDLDNIKLRYLKDYEPVILDPDQPFEAIEYQESPSIYNQVQQNGRLFVRRAPVFLTLAFLLPLGILAFLTNATIQTMRSRKRILLHEKDQDGHGFSVYRIPLLRDVTAGFQDAFEATNAAQPQERLPQSSEEETSLTRSDGLSLKSSYEPLTPEKSGHAVVKNTGSDVCLPQFATLALTATQFTMIRSLDQVGFRKRLVHIHKTGHSHAAIIVRSPSREALGDGKVVIKHWLESEFLV